MTRDATRPLPPPPLGAAPRSFRPAARGPPTRAGRRARRAVVRGARARRRGRRPSAAAVRTPAVAAELTDSRGGAGPGYPAGQGRRRRVAVGDRPRHPHRPRRSSGAACRPYARRPRGKRRGVRAPYHAGGRAPRGRAVNAARPRLPAAEVAAATLVCLPDMGPSRLRAVLDRWPDPGAALAAVRAGKAGDALARHARLVRTHEREALARSWARAARALALAPELAPRGTAVVRDSAPAYPIGHASP